MKLDFRYLYLQILFPYKLLNVSVPGAAALHLVGILECVGASFYHIALKRFRFCFVAVGVVSTCVPDKANSIVHNLHRGSVSRSSRALNASDVHEATAPVLEKLAGLHHSRPQPQVPPVTAVPGQVSKDQLHEVLLKPLSRGLAPGRGGWTFEHIQAVVRASASGTDSILDFVKARPKWFS